MSSFLKNLKKEASHAVSKATNPIRDAVKESSVGLTKIREGKLAEGLGDIGQAAAKQGLSTATAGNFNLADQASGGALTRATLAARGNSKDALATGAVLGATFAGGPMGGLTASQIIDKFGVNAQSLLAIGANAGASTLGGGEGELLGGLAKKLLPSPSVEYRTSQPASGYSSSSTGYAGSPGTNYLPMIGIGVAALLSVVLIAKAAKG